MLIGTWRGGLLSPDAFRPFTFRLNSRSLHPQPFRAQISVAAGGLNENAHVYSPWFLRRLTRIAMANQCGCLVLNCELKWDGGPIASLRTMAGHIVGSVRWAAAGLNEPEARGQTTVISVTLVEPRSYPGPSERNGRRHHLIHRI